MERLVIILAILITFSVLFAILLYVFMVMAEKISAERKIKRGSLKSNKIDKSRWLNDGIYLSNRFAHFVKVFRNNKLQFYANGIDEKMRIVGGFPENVDGFSFVGLQCFCAVLGLILSGLIIGTMNILILTAGSVIAFVLPYEFLKIKVKEKHLRLLREMPDFLNMLVLMIEAGLDFNLALSKTIETLKGPITDEFGIAQKEISLGQSRAAAFQKIADRIKFQPLTNVINTIILSLKTGSSLSQSLKVLSDQLRIERFQRAEKMAGEAPIKLMIPLALLIFPTIFIIIFGPIALSFIVK